MLGTKNRNIKILGAAWLVPGGIFFALAQIHRRDDYAAAERAIGAREGDGPGTIWGRGGPVSVFSCRGETL